MVLKRKLWVRSAGILVEGQNVQTLGSDADALEQYVSGLPQPFGIPLDFGQRITKEG